MRTSTEPWDVAGRKVAYLDETGGFHFVESCDLPEDAEDFIVIPMPGEGARINGEVGVLVQVEVEGRAITYHLVPYGSWDAVPYCKRDALPLFLTQTLDPRLNTEADPDPRAISEALASMARAYARKRAFHEEWLREISTQAMSEGEARGMGETVREMVDAAGLPAPDPL